MPQVGSKSFPYTPKGKASAKKFAKRTGKKMSDKKMKGMAMSAALLRGK